MYVEVYEYRRALNSEDSLPTMRSGWRSRESAQFRVSILNLACLSPAEVRRPSATPACHGSWTELKTHLASSDARFDGRQEARFEFQEFSLDE